MPTIKEFGNVVVDTTKGNKVRIQMIDAGKESGVFVNPIYVDNLKDAGIDLDDVIEALEFAWDAEAPAKQTKTKTKKKSNKKSAPKLTPESHAEAAAMALELYESGEKKAAQQLAKDAGIVATARGRGWDGLISEWEELAEGDDTPVSNVLNDKSLNLNAKQMEVLKQLAEFL